MLNGQLEAGTYFPKGFQHGRAVLRRALGKDFHGFIRAGAERESRGFDGVLNRTLE
jgi:hypothetical protein